MPDVPQQQRVQVPEPAPPVPLLRAESPTKAPTSDIGKLPMSLPKVSSVAMEDQAYPWAKAKGSNFGSLPDIGRAKTSGSWGRAPHYPPQYFQNYPNYRAAHANDYYRAPPFNYGYYQGSH